MKDSYKMAISGVLISVLGWLMVAMYHTHAEQVKITTHLEQMSKNNTECEVQTKKMYIEILELKLYNIHKEKFSVEVTIPQSDEITFLPSIVAPKPPPTVSTPMIYPLDPKYKENNIKAQIKSQIRQIHQLETTLK